MDAKAGLASFPWQAIRLLFDSDDPADVLKIVGLTRADVAGQPALSQGPYLESLLDSLPEEWKPKRVVKTNGQSSAAPDPKALAPLSCPTLVRSILGTLMYAARSVRSDLAHPVSRLAATPTSGRTRGSTVS